MALTLPQPKAVRDLFNELLGRDVTLEPCDAWSPGPGEPAWVGELVGDSGVLVGAFMLDLALTVQLGAAISLVPAKMAAEMIKDRKPTDAVLADVHEVLNVFTAVFNTPENPHVRLRRMLPVDHNLPEGLREALSSVGGREDYTLTIAGYGPGRVGLIT